jgi:hypothetical protein
VGGTCGTYGEGRGVYRVLVGRLEGKRPLGRRRPRLEGNIKLGLREVGIDEANWLQLAQDRVQWHALVNPLAGAQFDSLRMEPVSGRRLSWCPSTGWDPVRLSNSF